MKKEFPKIAYSELTIELYEYLKDIYASYGKSIRSFGSYVNEDKRYMSWNLTDIDKYVSYTDIYTCNSSGRDYYSLVDLGLTTKIYELW